MLLLYLCPYYTLFPKRQTNYMYGNFTTNCNLNVLYIPPKEAIFISMGEQCSDDICLSKLFLDCVIKESTAYFRFMSYETLIQLNSFGYVHNLGKYYEFF